MNELKFNRNEYIMHCIFGMPDVCNDLLLRGDNELVSWGTSLGYEAYKFFSNNDANIYRYSLSCYRDELEEELNKTYDVRLIIQPEMENVINELLKCGKDELVELAKSYDKVIKKLNMTYKLSKDIENYMIRNICSKPLFESFLYYVNFLAGIIDVTNKVNNGLTIKYDYSL